MYKRSFNKSARPGFSGAKPRPRFGTASRGFPRRQTGGRKNFGERIDPARFINKAVVMTEATEHFKPEHAFADFAIDERLKTAIAAKGYVLPTPIQDKTISHGLKGSDVVGIANTGTGKTAAFLIPLINKIMIDSKQKVIIIVPTRELAVQIESELIGFVRNIKTGPRINSVCCVGGAPIYKQIQALKAQQNFVIGTPGRLKDLVTRKCIFLSQFNTIVLDEADRMLDMGFIADMRLVVSQMPKDRQTLFFSATISHEVEGLIKDFLKDPVRISVKTGETARNVDQDVVHVRGGNKLDILHALLSKSEFSKVLIFGRTKHGVEKLSHALASKGFKAESIHGNKNFSQRQRALKSFKDNQAKILVATDVAARGLDIADVSHVINFDLPATHDDYVHRIGRTGRGNKTGKALTFIE